MSIEKSNPSKNQRKFFSPEDDQKLIQLVNRYGSSDWVKIAQEMGSWTTRQCRERYNHYLRPGIDANPWTPEEDALLLQTVAKYGTKWSIVKTHFPLRTDVNIKNRYARLTGRAAQSMKRKRAERKMQEQGIQPYQQVSFVQEHISQQIPTLPPLKSVPRPPLPLPLLSNNSNDDLSNEFDLSVDDTNSYFEDLFYPSSFISEF